MLYAYILIFMLASWLALYLPSELTLSKNLALSLLGAIFGFVFLIGALVKKAKLFRAPCYLLAFFCAVLVVQDGRIQSIVDAQLPDTFDGLAFLVEGRVSSMPQRDGEFVRFELDPDHVETIDGTESLALNNLLRLSWRSPRSLQMGERWRFKVRLKRPRGFVNPQGFDYQAWLLAKGVSATGYVYADAEKKSDGLRVQSFIALRDRVSRKLDGVFSGGTDHSTTEHSATEREFNVAHPELLRALLIGDKSGIDPAQWEIFKNTGTVHLMAISGLHVGLIAGFAHFIFRFFLRPLVFLSSPVYYRITLASVSITAALIYALLAGFSVPTQRAFFCVVLVNVILLLERRTPFLPMLGIIACGIVLSNPFAIQQAGFVLSFLAVAAILFAFGDSSHQSLPGFWGRMGRFFYAQWVVMIALFPTMAMLNLPSPIVAPLANSLAIPLLSFLILPIAFCALFVSTFSNELSHFLFHIAGNLLVLQMQSLELMANAFNKWGLNFQWQQVLNGKHLFILVLAAFVLLHPNGGRWRLLSGVLFFSVLVHAQVFRKVVRDEITILDVGQGLSTVVNGSKKTMIYDVGARFWDAFSIANQVLLPFLDAHRRNSVSHVVLSHADNDHAGAAPEFVRQLQQRQRSSFMVVSGDAEAIDVPGIKFCSTETIQSAISLSDEIQAKLLWPESVDRLEEKSNNRSCVLLITMHGKKILFSGDIEKEVEYRLLADEKLPENIDVLIAPHHGSGTSSTYLFLNWLKPRHVIFSAGYKNRYRHPSAKVLGRYEYLGSTIWNTAYHGALTISVDAGELVISSERIRQSRRWYSKLDAQR